MQTVLELDDRLLQQAMQDCGGETESAVVEAGLRLLVQMHAQSALRGLRGHVRWEGNLAESRDGLNEF